MIELINQDCRDYLQSIKSSDHVITDPPYSRHVHSKSMARSRRTTETKGDRKIIARKVDLGFAHLSKELRLFCAREFARIAQRWVLVFSDVESSGLWRRDLAASGLEYVRTAAWVKIGAAPQFTGDRPAPGFEAITIAHKPGKKRWNGGGKQGIYAHPIVLDRGGSTRAKESRIHTTQKPISLMLDLVRDFTDEGDTIVDPFAGSCTTLRAAQRLKRNASGCEIDLAAYESGLDAIEAEAEHSSIHYRRAKQVAMFSGSK